MRCLCLLFACILTVDAFAQVLFTQIPSEESGVTFRNDLAETEDLNIITYEYFYNGGGVAVADFDNDGLPDLYFTGNIVGNKLFRNLGNFRFKDVSRSAGVSGRRGWRTGVSVADVNGDGYVDIYVCYSGDVDRKLRRNQLFINNGDLTFTDRAVEMGVADEGYSTQAVFFDYDRDQDLDLFVVNHNIHDLRNFDAAYVKKMTDPDAGDRLYRNDNNIFTDVTSVSGIISNPLGYGLGVVASDINNDGWMDLYVANDYVEEDYLYINNHNGTFSEKLKSSFGHLSYFTMGVDIADVNNDGWQDVFTLDMLPEDNKRQKLIYAPDNYEAYLSTVKNGFHHQQMRNMLQLNNGDGTFSEIGQVAGVSNTDWSWSALIADYNNDGRKDIFVTNGYGRDMINRDFMKFYANERLRHLKGEKNERMLGMLKGVHSTPLHNYIFENVDGMLFRDRTMQWGFLAADFSHGAVYADLDNDGDLDLVTNRMNEVAGVFRNNLSQMIPDRNWVCLDLRMPEKNRFAIGAKVFIYTPKGIVTQENLSVRGFQSSMNIPMHLGLASSEIDSAVVYWPDGTKQKLADLTRGSRYIVHPEKSTAAIQSVNQKTGIFRHASSQIPFVHREDVANDFKKQPLIPNMSSYSGPRIAKGDVNNDKLEDVFVCGAAGQPGKIFIQTENGSFLEMEQRELAKDFSYEDVDAAFFDVDSDGDDDLYVVSGGFLSEKNSLDEDRLYINEQGVFKKKLELPILSFSGACIRPVDIDKDGDIDLFRGARVNGGRYPETPSSAILVNDGNGNFSNVTDSLAPELSAVGMVTDAIWLDLDQDLSPELIVAGEWMPITVFKFAEGMLRDSSAKYFGDIVFGWWNRIKAADFDRDGDVDLVAANWGLNSQLKCSETEPVTLHYADFDRNGSVDPIICSFIKGTSYPMASRDELTDQIISLRRKYPTYDSYSSAKLNEIFDPGVLAAAEMLKCTSFETTYFENRDGVFIRRSLPLQANFFPVYAIAVDDFNHDGNLDIVFGGNVERTRIRLGKSDASYGTLLAGDGKGNFTYVPQTQAGLSISGCVRDIVEIKTGNKRSLVFGINDNQVQLYSYGQ
jgi:enediyne biosynthesis protein E4